MSGAAGTGINVMLAIHSKRASSVDLNRPIRKYIAEYFSERDAKDSEDDLLTVQQMRNDIERAADTLEARRDLLQRYYRALCAIELRFPISSEREHVNNVWFTWTDAFKSSRRASQQNIHLEKAAIVFNLGAVQSQMALAADRSSQTGLKLACNGFQSSAGAFAFLRDNISIKASGGSNAASSSVDISIECSGMLERLMLAQAQECYYEKAVADEKPPSICARIARQTAMYYEEALAALQLPPLNTHFDRNWIGHVQLKTAQYQGESLYRLSLDLHEKENIAEEISRLKVASALLSEARKNVKGITGPLMEGVTKLEGAIARNLERANKENDRVYLMRVPHPDTLPPVPPASLVSSAPQDELMDGSKDNLFATLVPDSCAKALSKYSEMVDNLIRDQTEKLQQASDLMRTKIRDMGVAEALQALETGGQLPSQLHADVAAVQSDGGINSIYAEVSQLKDLRRVNEELLVQAEEALDKEANEDAQMRAQLGSRWTRPQSATLAKILRDRSSGFAGNLRQAGDSDARIERSIKDNEELLKILDFKPIESALPKLTKPMVSVHANEDEVIANLRRLLEEMEKLGAQRAGLEDMLKSMKQKDNILPKLMNCGGLYEDLFKKEMLKYESITVEVSKNIDAQELVFRQIKGQNDIFASIFNMKDYEVAKARTVSQITSAVTKYREIKANINEGLKFYVTLQDAITNLKQQCGDYVLTRGIQCREMMEDLQRQIAGLNFGGGRHGQQQQGQGGGGIFSIFNRGKDQQPSAPAPAAPAPSTHYMPVPPPGAQAHPSAQGQYQQPPVGYYAPGSNVYPSAPPPGHAPPTGQWPQQQSQAGYQQPGPVHPSLNQPRQGGYPPPGSYYR